MARRGMSWSYSFAPGSLSVSALSKNIQIIPLSKSVITLAGPINPPTMLIILFFVFLACGALSALNPCSQCPAPHAHLPARSDQRGPAVACPHALPVRLGSAVLQLQPLLPQPVSTAHAATRAQHQGRRQGILWALLCHTGNVYVYEITTVSLWS